LDYTHTSNFTRAFTKHFGYSPREHRELRTPNSELRTPNSELRTPNSELRTPNSELRTGQCGQVGAKQDDS
jgi:AraC-like DNA-binding protein